MKEQFDTPILFLIFNRPDTTKQVFERIKEIRPKYLYVAADGPRRDKLGEDTLCEKARDIVVDNIDWDCEVKILFRSGNLGCKDSVSSAISWFFEKVEYGIILEDDCLPSLSFFQYCKFLLEEYASANNISIISGTSYLNEKNEDYFFSRLFSIWGWATWAKVWNKVQFNILEEDKLINDLILSKIGDLQYAQSISNNIINTKNGTLSSWDTYFSYHHYKNDYLSITPTKNLIKNIGETGTHYKRKSNFNNRKSYNIPKFSHRKRIDIDVDKENISFQNILLIMKKDLQKYSKYTLLNRIKDSYEYRIKSRMRCQN